MPGCSIHREGPNRSGSPDAAAALVARSIVTVAGGLAVFACAPRETEEPPDVPRAAPTRVTSVEGFSTPESVRYDGDQDVFFVSNINGNPSAKDNNGFISRLHGPTAVDTLRFIAGGRGGVTLHAPKGMAIVGDTLWVADIDALRGFNRRTGMPVATIEFADQARFLNDVAAGPDGTIYVTDTGIAFDAQGEVSHPGPDRVFRITGRSAEVVLEGTALAAPNGIAWDESAGRLLIASFMGNNVLAWTPGEPTPAVLASGPGQFDGVEILEDGRVLVSSWADSTVYLLEPGGSTLAPLITGVASPADIGYDTRRRRLAIPLFMENRVEFWEVH